MKQRQFCRQLLSLRPPILFRGMLLLAGFAGAFWSIEAKAAQSSEPEALTAVYGDWTVQCSTTQLDPAPARVCEIVQTIRATTQASEAEPGKPINVAQVAIGRVRVEEPYQVTVLLPFDVVLTSPVSIALEAAGELLPALVWSRCIPAGCLANIAVSEATLKQLLQATGSAKLRWQPASAAQPFQAPVSLKGLPSAFEYLSSKSRR